MAANCLAPPATRERDRSPRSRGSGCCGKPPSGGDQVFCRKRRIPAIELIERLAADLELALHCGAQDEIGIEIRKLLPAVMSAIAVTAARASQRRLFASRLKDGLTCPLDAFLEIGIANCARLDKVDIAAEQRFKRLLEVEKGLERQRLWRRGVELHQEVEIAARRVEIRHSPPSRTGQDGARGTGGTVPPVPLDAMQSRQSSDAPARITYSTGRSRSDRRGSSRWTEGAGAHPRLDCDGLCLDIRFLEARPTRPIVWPFVTLRPRISRRHLRSRHYVCVPFFSTGHPNG